MYKAGAKTGVIVPKESASLAGIDPQSIQANHVDMCKFEDGIGMVFTSLAVPIQYPPLLWGQNFRTEQKRILHKIERLSECHIAFKYSQSPSRMKSMCPNLPVDLFATPS